MSEFCQAVLNKVEALDNAARPFLVSLIVLSVVWIWQKVVRIDVYYFVCEVSENIFITSTSRHSRRMGILCATCVCGFVNTFNGGQT